MHRQQINPSSIHPLRDLVLVTHYTRPNEFGSLLLPGNYAKDTTMTLWEVVKASKGAEAALGMPLPAGCILQTLRRWPVDSGLDDAAGNQLFFISVSAKDRWGGAIRGVIIYTLDADSAAV